MSLPTPRRRVRAGHTLPEVAVALTLVAILLLAATVPARRLLDQAAVHAAASELATLLAVARELAVAGARPVAVRFDPEHGAATVLAGRDTLRRLALAADYGVTLATTRDSTAFAASGLGAGAANLSAVLTRGAAAETLFVSRLGRVRW
ncbi:MAG TPA: GspH/FimT family pseudopilin [Gemmatimonadaceae bacterium]|nr:GspH/FimT family pseudopilin [Gemmatimonadaceae bacterium]